MPARRYRPSGKSAPGALPALLLGPLAAAAATGALEALVSPWFYLLLLFPALVGTASGLVAHLLVERHRVRAPLLAAGLAAVGSLGGGAAYHLVEYAHVRAAAAEVLRRPTLAPGAGLAAAAGGAAALGFTDYLQLKAERGTPLRRAGTGPERGLRLGGTTTRVLWALELLLAMGLAAGIAAARAREPYCERCDRWYDKTKTVGAGSGAQRDVDAVAHALEALDMAAAVGALGTPTEQDTSLLQIRCCSSCRDHEPLLSLIVMTDRTRKLRTRTRYRGLLHAAEARALLDALAARSARHSA